MYKLYAAVLGFAIALLCEAVFAAPAIVDSLTGNVQALPGAGAPRVLRLGDDVNQGETISTGANSSVVLRFEDGQIVALTANSRMAVNAYAYNRQNPAQSNVLISLVEGGMRAITGLIGRQRPQAVSYRAGNATIGIRGTDVTFATLAGDVTVSVTNGEISFDFGGQTTSITAGEGVNATRDGRFQKASAAQIAANAPQALKDALGGVQALQAAILAAIQRASQQPTPPGGTVSPLSPLGTPNTTSSSGGVGGGGASTR